MVLELLHPSSSQPRMRLWFEESRATASDVSCLLLAILVAFRNTNCASGCFSLVIEEFQLPPSSWLGRDYHHTLLQPPTGKPVLTGRLQHGRQVVGNRKVAI